MATIFFLIAAVFFFLAGVGVTILPSPLAWGLCATAIGLATWDRMPIKGMR